MKKRILSLIVFATIMLCSLCTAFAEDADYIVKFKDGYLPDMTEYTLEAIEPEKSIYAVSESELERIPEEYIEYSAPNEKVSLIEGEMPVMTLALPQDEFNPEQWQLQMINTESAWQFETYGNGIKVAVIDSGCIAHEDLVGNLLEGKNYITGTTDVTDTYGHGTHVSGIIAAQMNDVGICGVAPKAKIVPLKCFEGNDDADLSNILRAIYDAVDVYGCQIINMSWGTAEDNEFLKQAINYAYNKGAILVAAVGNDRGTAFRYPAAYNGVIGVTSVGLGKNHSSFAQYNNSVTVAAPGEQVLSTYKDGDYIYMSGTSQAAPMISGIAALALSADKKITNGNFAWLIIDSAEDLGDEGYDVYYGYGLANVTGVFSRILRTMPYYVSPVNETEDSAYVLIRNNTTELFSATSLFAQYNNGKYEGCKNSQLILMPGKTNVIATEKTKDTEVAHFLWKLSTLTPLVEERKSER